MRGGAAEVGGGRSVEGGLGKEGGSVKEELDCKCAATLILRKLHYPLPCTSRKPWTQTVLKSRLLFMHVASRQISRCHTSTASVLPPQQLKPPQESVCLAKAVQLPVQAPQLPCRLHGHWHRGGLALRLCRPDLFTRAHIHRRESCLQVTAVTGCDTCTAFLHLIRSACARQVNRCTPLSGHIVRDASVIAVVRALLCAIERRQHNRAPRLLCDRVARI